MQSYRVAVISLCDHEAFRIVNNREHWETDAASFWTSNNSFWFIGNFPLRKPRGVIEKYGRRSLSHVHDPLMELNRETDDEKLKTLENSVKNKFRWHWLETTVEISLKGERKTIPIVEWIRKIDVPGKAKCIICQKLISYGARGRVSLTEHCKSNEHSEKLKLKADNYTLGVRAPNESYGIHPFFLKSKHVHVQQPEVFIDQS